jgi:hypothetical protein
MKYSASDLETRYQKFTASVTCRCTFVTELVGGQPAGDEQLKAFITHHLKIVDPVEAEKAFKRIKEKEIEPEYEAAHPFSLAKIETDEPQKGHEELRELKVYGVNVIRKSEHGPWVGSWMPKACLKAAASRLNLFVEVRGTKGNMAEAGRVEPFYESCIEPKIMDRIYVLNGNGPAPTYFKEIMGRVSGPQGSVSIVQHAECIAPGATFSFRFRFLPGKLTEEQVTDVFALAQNIGLGSAKALDRGKFKIEEMEIDMGTAREAKAAHRKKE